MNKTSSSRSIANFVLLVLMSFSSLALAQELLSTPQPPVDGDQVIDKIEASAPTVDPDVPVDSNPTGTEQDLDAGSKSIFEDGKKFKCAFLERNCARQLFNEHLGDGSKMTLLINGEMSLAARLQVLDQARQSVRIEALEFTGDDTGYYIAGKLKQMKMANPQLDIRIIVDAISNRSPQTRSMYEELNKAGIPVTGAAHAHKKGSELIYDLVTRPFNINRRFHEKMWVIDAEDPVNGVAIVGGMNIANGYMRVGAKPFRDQDLYLKGPIVKDIMSTFEANFKYHMSILAKAKSGIHEVILSAIDLFLRAPEYLAFVPNPINIQTIQSAETRALPFLKDESRLEPADILFIQNKPRFREKYIPQAYVRLIDSVAAIARNKPQSHPEIRIANPYFIPPADVKSALSRAVLAGVKVIILTNGIETTDSAAVTYVSRFDQLPLLQLNIDPKKDPRGSLQIFEWGKPGDPSFDEGLLHEKIAIFGHQRVIVGSYNLDPRSENLNSEVIVTFRSEKLAQTLTEQFAVDISRSTEVTLAQAQYNHVRHGTIFTKFIFLLDRFLSHFLF